MKTLTFINRFLILIMALTAIGFSSCSKEDEPETGEQPTEDAGGRRLVSKLEYSSPEDGDWVVRFFYNKDGSLQKVTNDVDELREVTLTRTGNELNLKLDYEDGVDKIICALNKDGYVTSCLYEDEDRYTYEYQNGFLSRARFSNSLQPDVTWQDGDIVKVVINDFTTRCTYINRENKMNLDLFDLTYSDLFDDFELSMTSGYWGKRNKHLLKKVETVYSWGKDLHEFSYDFDSEGYVTHIFYTMEEWWNSEQRTWASTVTVTYVD